MKEAIENLKWLMKQVVRDRATYLSDDHWGKVIAALALAIAALEEIDKDCS